MAAIRTKRSASKKPSEVNDGIVALKAELGDRVVGNIGHPNGFWKVDVHHLWNARFRVNVWVKDEKGVPAISDSFFIVLSSAGDVVSSNPEMTERHAKRRA